jgi:hypothetical protein
MDKLTRDETEWILDILIKERESLVSSEHEALTDIILKIDSSLNPSDEE